MTNKLGSIIGTLTSPKAYSTYAAIGVGVTVVLAILNTRKQCKIENEQKSQEGYSEKELTREDVKEEVKTTIKTYAPTIVSTLATVYCINKAESGWVDYSGVLASTLTTTERRIDQLRKSAPGLIAANVWRKIESKNLDGEQKWFCIPATGNFPDLIFSATDADVWHAMLELNRTYAIRGTASLKDFLCYLGILSQFDDPDIIDMVKREGEHYGWDVSLQLDDCPEIAPWIDFNLQTVERDGRRVTTITPDIWTSPPKYSRDRLSRKYPLHPYE